MTGLSAPPARGGPKISLLTARPRIRPRICTGRSPKRWVSRGVSDQFPLPGSGLPFGWQDWETRDASVAPVQPSEGMIA